MSGTPSPFVSTKTWVLPLEESSEPVPVEGTRPMFAGCTLPLELTEPPAFTDPTLVVTVFMATWFCVQTPRPWVPKSKVLVLGMNLQSQVSTFAGP